MKIKIALLAFCCITMNIFAQQEPLFNNYIYNENWYNPASYGDGFFGVQYRQQWSDLDAALAPTSFSLNGDISKFLSLKEKNIGLGFSLLADRTHILERNNFNLGFAYHLVQEDQWGVALGIQAGVLQQRLELVDRVLTDFDDLILMEEAQNKLAFQGGPGLSFYARPADGHQIKANLALPQLYSSYLDEDSGAPVDLNPHVIAGLSYLFDTEAVDVEPLVLYRGALDSASTKGGNVDLALRLHFLDRALWVGGGLRMSSETVHGAVGFRPMRNLEIIVHGELHQQLGTTIEIGIAMDFTAPVASCNSPEQVQLETIKDKALNSLGKATANKADLESRLAKVKGFIESIQFSSNKTEQLEWSQEAEEELAIIEKRLDKVKELEVQANQLSNEAQLINSSKPTSCGTKTISKIQMAVEDIKHIRLVSSTDVKMTADALELAKEKNNLRGTDYLGLVKAKKTFELREVLNNRLNELEAKPAQTFPVRVGERTNGDLEIVYEFPFSQEIYVLEDNARVVNLINHIAEVMETLQKNKVGIEQLELYTDLQVDKVTWDYQETEVVYNPERINFGAKPICTYDFISYYQTPGVFKKGRQLEIPVGQQLKLKELIALKLMCIEKQLNSSVASKKEIQLSPRAASYQQFLVKIIVR